jgi:hypothetical protein
MQKGIAKYPLGVVIECHICKKDIVKVVKSYDEWKRRRHYCSEVCQEEDYRRRRKLWSDAKKGTNLKRGGAPKRRSVKIKEELREAQRVTAARHKEYWRCLRLHKGLEVIK